MASPPTGLGPVAHTGSRARLVGEEVRLGYQYEGADLRASRLVWALVSNSAARWSSAESWAWASSAYLVSAPAPAVGRPPVSPRGANPKRRHRTRRREWGPRPKMYHGPRPFGRI